MIWIILWFVGVIACIVCAIRESYGIWDKIWGAIITGIISFLFGLLCAAGLNDICYIPSDNSTIVETQEIYSLKDNTYLSGYGFISVRIEEEDKYTYMAINEDGTYSKKSIESENVKIKEVDDCTPVLEVYEREPKNKLWCIFPENNYCFVVPKGTVVNTFNIDLE